MGIFAGLLLWNINYATKTSNNPDLFRGMFFLSVLISYLWWFIYFIVIPYYWKGYTLFKKAFKLKTHELIDSTKFFQHLVKKECMIWMPIFLVLFIYSIVLSSFQDDPLKMLQTLLNYQNTNTHDYINPIFQFLFIFSIIPVIIIMIHMAINSKKRALHDIFSDTCVVYLVPMEGSDTPKINSRKLNLDLPGMIDEDVLMEQLDG